MALLQYMEATTVYNTIDQNSPLFSPIAISTPISVTYTYKSSGCLTTCACASAIPAAQVIPALVCPSCPRVQNPFTEMTQCWDCCIPTIKNMTRLNGANCYRVWCRISGCIKCYYDYLTIGKECCGTVIKTGHKGVFSDAQFLTYDQIVDGTSTTIMATEMGGRPDLWARASRRARRAPLTTGRDSPPPFPAVAGPARPTQRRRSKDRLSSAPRRLSPDRRMVPCVSSTARTRSKETSSTLSIRDLTV